jgi:LmbE family N-acetylglucosaminyl deacetylase
MSSLVVVSPHLDDGVFSCGALLARHPESLVVTALAGGASTEGVTEWDTAGGFSSSAEAVATRRQEDLEALALLAATPVWLEFPDSQYGGSPGVELLAEALARVITAAGPAVIALPLGLFHSDHTLTSEASLRAFAHGPAACLLYEDAIYRRFEGLRDERLEAHARAGRRLKPEVAPPESTPAVKRAAVACYRSQLRALSSPGRPGYDDAFGEERYWRLV